MNYHNASFQNTSAISDQMLILNGDLKSGFNSGTYKMSKSPHNVNRAAQSSYPQQAPVNQYPPDLYKRSMLRSVNVEVQQVLDQSRKKPFTIPYVKVEVYCGDNVEASNVRTRQSTISNSYQN